jgi:hypothetical protein
LNKLHLGCGNNYLNEYINIDNNTNSVADIVFDIRNIGKLFKKNSIAEIRIIHAISYLRLFEARDFFLMCFNILKPNGKLVIEFPDIIKCAKIIINNNINWQDSFQYIEGIRGIYAFDLEQIKNRVQYIPYCFGWSAEHIKYELISFGFKEVLIADGNAHERPQRDTRIEAIK